MENYGTLILVNMLFAVIIIHSLIQSRKIILSGKIKNSKKVILLVGSIIIVGIIMYWGRGWYYYLAGFIGAIAFIVSSIFDGISEEGIQARSSLLIKNQPWDGLARIKLVRDDYISLDYSGNRANNIIYFENSQYEELISILNKNLDKKLKKELRK